MMPLQDDQIPHTIDKIVTIDIIIKDKQDTVSTRWNSVSPW